MASVDVELGVSPESTYSVAGKQLKFDSHADIEPYLKELGGRKGLTKIDFSGNTIGVEASGSLAKALLQHKDTVVEVDFSDLYTGRLNTEIPKSLDYLLPALLQFSQLRLVNLSDNAFGLQTIDPIERYLSRATTLNHLILSNNGMGPFAGARIGKSLFHLARAQKKAKTGSLKTFICGRNRLENGSIDYLAIGLRNHADLETVRLYQNGIRPAGIAKLVAKGLSQNKALKVLDLQDNTITTKGAVELSGQLEKSTWLHLVELNLNDCLLKPKGSLKLADALASGATLNSLKTLKLQYNELENDALKALASALKNLPKLHVLELNGNRFEEDAEAVEEINSVFEERGFGELDELDELEEIDSDEDEEDDEEDEDEEDAEDLEDLERALEGVKLEDDDKSVDDITGSLSKTHLG